MTPGAHIGSDPRFPFHYQGPHAGVQRVAGATCGPRGRHVQSLENSLEAYPRIWRASVAARLRRRPRGDQQRQIREFPRRLRQTQDARGAGSARGKALRGRAHGRLVGPGDGRSERLVELRRIHEDRGRIPRLSRGDDEGSGPAGQSSAMDRVDPELQRDSEQVPNLSRAKRRSEHPGRQGGDGQRSQNRRRHRKPQSRALERISSRRQPDGVRRARIGRLHRPSCRRRRRRELSDRPARFLGNRPKHQAADRPPDPRHERARQGRSGRLDPEYERRQRDRRDGQGRARLPAGGRRERASGERGGRSSRAGRRGARAQRTGSARGDRTRTCGRRQFDRRRVVETRGPRPDLSLAGRHPRGLSQAASRFQRRDRNS